MFRTFFLLVHCADRNDSKMNRLVAHLSVLSVIAKFSRYIFIAL